MYNRRWSRGAIAKMNIHSPKSYEGIEPNLIVSKSMQKYTPLDEFLCISIFVISNKILLYAAQYTNSENLIKSNLKYTLIAIAFVFFCS